MTFMPLHAFGARYDLPAPLYLFLLGAGAVVFVSFLLVLQRPVGRREPVGDDVPPVAAVASWPGWVLVVLSILLIAAGLFGTQSTPDSILPTAFWLVFWIAVPMSIAIVGNYWPYVSPLNVVARLVGTRARWPYPRSWGYWPAALLFFLFACGELVFNGVTTTSGGAAVVMLAYGILNVHHGGDLRRRDLAPPGRNIFCSFRDLGAAWIFPFGRAGGARFLRWSHPALRGVRQPVDVRVAVARIRQL